MDEVEYRRRVLRWRGVLGGLVVLLVLTAVEGAVTGFDALDLWIEGVLVLGAVGVLRWVHWSHRRDR